MNIQSGDYITTERYQERMRVLRSYKGAWSGAAMLDCEDPLFKFISRPVYVEDVVQHYSQRKKEADARSDQS